VVDVHLTSAWRPKAKWRGKNIEHVENRHRRLQSRSGCNAGARCIDHRRIGSHLAADPTHPAPAGTRTATPTGAINKGPCAARTTPGHPLYSQPCPDWRRRQFVRRRMWGPPNKTILYQKYGRAASDRFGLFPRIFDFARHSSRWWRHPGRDTWWRQEIRPGGLLRTRRWNRAGLPSEPGRCFCQYVAFLLQATILLPQPCQFLPLGGRDTVGTAAAVQLSLPKPVADRFSGGLELLSQFTYRATSSGKFDNLPTKLRWVWKAGSWHLDLCVYHKCKIVH
jgi:hypothetical protein